MSAHRLPVFSYRYGWSLTLCAAALLGGCGPRYGDDFKGLDAPVSEPAAAIHHLAEHLRNDDLSAYAKAAVPARQYAELEQAWAQGYSRWPLTEFPLSEHLPDLLASLSEENASDQLKTAFRTQIAGEAEGVRSTAHFIGLWARLYLRQHEAYTPTERAHYQQIVTALIDWVQIAPITDPWRANSAIARLTAAARSTALSSDEALQKTGMSLSLVRLRPSFSAFKYALAEYGLSLNDTLAGVRTELIQQLDNQATVRVRYPLAGQNIDFQVKMERRNGRWYSAQTLNEVDSVLANWHRTTAELKDDFTENESTAIQTPKERSLIDLIREEVFFE